MRPLEGGGSARELIVRGHSDVRRGRRGHSKGRRAAPSVL